MGTAMAVWLLLGSALSSTAAGAQACSSAAISDTITIHPEVFLTQAKDVSVLEESS